LSLSVAGNQRNWGRYWRKPGTRWSDKTSPVRALQGRQPGETRPSDVATVR